MYVYYCQSAADKLLVLHVTLLIKRMAKHSPFWIQGHMFRFLVSRGLLCLCNKQNNTWLLVDRKFLLNCTISLVCWVSSLDIKFKTLEAKFHFFACFKIWLQTTLDIFKIKIPPEKDLDWLRSWNLMKYYLILG